MSSFNVAEAQLTALFMESVFYGLFLATFFACLRALLWHGDSFRGTSNIKWTLLFVACAMSINGTVDILLNFQHNIEAFVLYTGAGGAVGEFSVLRNWINVARGVTWAIQAILGDAILVYRVHIVWDRKWFATALPLLLWFGTSITSSAIPYCEGQVSGEALLTIAAVNDWTNACVIVTLVLNVVGTTMIAYRMWSVNRRTSTLPAPTSFRPLSFSRRPLEYAMRIIVESGLMYTASAIVLFISSETRSLSIYAVSDCLTQIIGICFTLIIVRVNWDNAAAAEHALVSHGGLRSTASHGIPLHFSPTSSKARAHGRRSGAMLTSSADIPLQVTVRKDVEFDAGSRSEGAHAPEKPDGESVWVHQASTQVRRDR